MKKFQLEVWNTFDKLCLMSAITKLKTSFADQNWVAISRYTKQLHENVSSFIQYDNRSDEWFSAKQCSAQYEVLIKGSGARKKKKVDRNFDYSDVHEALLVSINQEFCEELQLSLKEIREEYLQTKQLIEELDSDKIDDDRLDELIAELLEKEKGSDIKTKLKSMLDEKNAIESESSTKYSSQNLLPNEPSTSNEHKAANITTSPLLTSLLQSPSPLVRPSPSTSSPTISLLLHSSPSVSLTDPTLSKLLESPTSLPGTSTVSSLENTSFLFQGTMLDSQQSSSEAKKKKSDDSEEMPAQRIINDPVEFQRTEGFDDMSDIEQGVVESEVIIENESSPIKRLTPRRLDLENIGDEEPEEEILETVEEIIERVEEAIIETVGENNLNELVLNEGIDTVSISDEEIENINIEDNTYEVIVVGSQEEAVPSSSEASDDSLIIEGSVAKVDKIKSLENHEVVKSSEIFPLDDHIGSDDAIPKSINHRDVDVCNEVSLIKSFKDNEKSCNEKDLKEKSGINITDRVDEEVSDKLITDEEKSVTNIVISVHEKCLDRSDDDNRSYDLDIDSGLTIKEKSFTVNSKIICVKPPELPMSSASEDNNDSIVESINEVLLDKQVNDINQCQNILLSNDSAPNPEPIKPIISLENKDNKPIEEKLTEEIEIVKKGNDFEAKSQDEIIKPLDEESHSNKIEVDSDDSKKIHEIKGDYLVNISQNVMEGQDEKEWLNLQNEKSREKSLNADKNDVDTSVSDKVVVLIDSEQSAVLPTLADESTTTEPVAEVNHLNKDSDQISRAKTENEELVEATEICKDQVISIDSNAESSKESVNSNIERESILSIDEQLKKKDITSKPLEFSSLLSSSHSEEESKQVNTKNESLKDETNNKNKFDFDDIKQNPSIVEDIKSKFEKNIGLVVIPKESDEIQETLEVQVTPEAQETLEAQKTPESQETCDVQESNKAEERDEAEESHKDEEGHKPPETVEAQKTKETLETHESQESHDGLFERISGPIYIESDESKSDSTEETEDNSILTTEDSKDGLDDSLKFSSLETLSMPSVDSPPEYNDPKFAGLSSKEREFRSLIGKGFEELKSKAAELVFIPDASFEDKTCSRKHAKVKNKPRTKKDKQFKTKKITGKTNWEKSNENNTAKEKASKDRASNKDKSINEKSTNSGRKSKYLSSLDSKPDSPSPSTTSSDEDRDYKSWKKSILLVYNRLASHKYASVFSKPITENEAPSYHQIILRPMDLSTIKRNIENGVIRTTVEFQRDMLLMVQNAIIYNKYDTPVYDMAKAMGEDMLAQMEVMVQALGDGVPLIGDTSEEKQITRARTSKSLLDTPQTKKRKTQEPDEIRPKRNKLSIPC